MSTVSTRAARSRVLALFTSFAMIAAGVLGLALSAPASATPAGKIRICHATASTNNPYTSPTVDMSSIDEANNANHNGHGDHTGPVYDGVMTSGWGDIIPPFTYTYIERGGQGQPDQTVTVDYPGLNWSAEGQAIYYNGCGFPPKPDTIYRTVFWCDADDVRQSEDQSSTDGGVTWTPSAPADATTNPKLKCGTTPIERTMYWCDADDVLQSQLQTSTDKGVTWKPDVPANAVEDDALTCGNTPDPDPKPKPEVITYRDTASLSASEDICTVNGTLRVDVTGNGLGESTVSQADAAKVATGNAQLDLEYNLRMAKAQFPGATDGACAPVEPTVVEPAVVDTPAVVAVPGKATVTDVPARVPVPSAVTMPASVPAGGGSSTPGIPAWALALLVVGALGAVVTGMRAMRDSQ
jgi:hypothetical protein